MLEITGKWGIDGVMGCEYLCAAGILGRYDIDFFEDFNGAESYVFEIAYGG